MNEKDPKNLVPAEEIAISTPPIEVARGIEPASMSAPRRDLAGLRLMHLTGPKIYLVNPEGVLQWIPDGSTYNNLFRDWNGVQKVDIAPMTVGPALSHGAVLAKGDATNEVFLVSNGKKRWITSGAVMDKYYFNWDRVFVVPQVLVNSIYAGNLWS